MNSRPIEILLVEDSLGDIRLIQEVLKDSKLQTNLSVVQDGVQALAFLRGEGSYTGVPRPDLILLDLNLPRKNGREVLAEIKKAPNLKRIPVVVLTTSDAHKDILVSYNLHVNAYITKPADMEEFTDIIKAIEDFWFQSATLPPE
jgi:CheY-like chemotaxis protein